MTTFVKHCLSSALNFHSTVCAPPWTIDPDGNCTQGMARLNGKDHVNVADQFQVERGEGQCVAVCEGDSRQFCGGMKKTTDDCSHLPPFGIDHCADDPGV